MRRRLAGLVTTALVAGLLPILVGQQAASAASFPSGFTDTPVAGSLGQPTALAQLPDGRFLVTSQGGKLEIVQGSSATVAIDLTGRICSSSEMGLLGVAVDPQFSSNGFIYLYYTTSNGGCALPGNSAGGTINRVSRFKLTGSTVDPNSEVKLIDNMPEWGGNHDGGYVHVAHDGTLFISVGDGGAGAPSTNPHDLSKLNGKILRINRDGSIPADNPFANGGVRCNVAGEASPGQVCAEIWATGLRNPFRLAFKDDDPGVSFRINDVGDATWEEVDDAAKGANYGWPEREGPCPRGGQLPCSPAGGGVTEPVLYYNHSIGCNVETGGAFVPAAAWQGYAGAYLWVDFGCGKLFVAQPGQTGNAPAVLATGLNQATDMQFFKQDGSWALFYTTYANGGQLHKVTAPAPTQIPATIPGTKFSAVQPTRLLDTRNGTGIAAGKLAGGSAISLKVTGGTVPDNARAVALNLTATLTDAAGFVTAWPTGLGQPPTSSLNVSGPGETAANAVVVPVGQGGQINLFTFAGTHLVADVTGYFTDAGGTTDGRFHAAAGPTRLLDTRTGEGGKLGAFLPNQAFDLAVGGVKGVPADATAVALTVTYTGPGAPGYLTVWPTGQPQPLASTANPNGVGDIRSNLALIPLGTGGKVSIFSFAQTDVVVDVVGWFAAGGGGSGLFSVTTPNRAADSRQPAAPFGRIVGGTEATMDFTNFVSGGASAVLYNLTATNTVAGGYLTAHPAGTAVPLASSVNWSGPDQNRAALTVSSLASSNKVGVFAFSDVDAVVDVSGWFSG